MTETKNILDPSALLSSLPQLLPKSSSLKSPQDAVAALLHTILVTLSFRLIAVDDDSPAAEHPQGLLPESWNSRGPGHYVFRYRHEQSSLEFVLKVAKLGDRTLMHGLALGSDRTATVDIKTSDYTSESFFPHVIGTGFLVHGYISSNRLDDFVSSVKLKILSQLLPGLNKEGYHELDNRTPESSSADRAAQQGNRPSASTQPIDRRPVHPIPYGIIERQGFIPPENPLSIGRSDLDPIPQNPFAPPSLFGPRHGGDGMFVGPDHPIFTGRRDPLGGMIGGRGPWGGDGFLPPMGAPPGARFDPVGPSFGGFPGRGGFVPRGGSQPQRGGDPDNDELMPPGANDMFM